jgi:hypothetical protein
MFETYRLNNNEIDESAATVIISLLLELSLGEDAVKESLAETACLKRKGTRSFIVRVN